MASRMPGTKNVNIYVKGKKIKTMRTNLSKIPGLNQRTASV
jgi:hypothetical protein